MKRFEVAILIGIVFAVFMSSFTVFANDCDAVRQNVVRLHILANSDTTQDQELKLKVRDAVLIGTADIFAVSATKAEVEQSAISHTEEIRKLAEAELLKNQSNYCVSVEMVNMFFDTRTYGEVTLPAGHYDAVRIIIGQGKGKNWWCVMFPPMCIPAAIADGGEKDSIQNQIENLGRAPVYKPKFAVVEIIESLRDKLAVKKEEQATSLLEGEKAISLGFSSR